MGDEPAAVVRRVLPAPPDEVYGEWLDPAAMADWMCPRPARAVTVEMDARPGGTLRIAFTERGALVRVTGQFLELDRPRTLRFTWTCSDWVDPTVQSMVTVTFEASGANETLMTIRHAQLPPEQIDGHRRGWAAVAAQLASALAAR